MMYAECFVNNGEVICTNGVSVKEFNGVLRIYVDVDKPVVFSSKVDVKVLCSGLDFQTHTWGLERKTLWFFEKGLNICLIVRNVVLERYGNVIVVKKIFEEWRPPIEVLNQVMDLHGVKFINKPLILLSPSLNINVCFKNIIPLLPTVNPQECLEDLTGV